MKYRCADGSEKPDAFVVFEDVDEEVMKQKDTDDIMELPLEQASPDQLREALRRLKHRADKEE